MTAGVFHVSEIFTFSRCDCWQMRSDMELPCGFSRSAERPLKKMLLIKVGNVTSTPQNAGTCTNTHKLTKSKLFAPLWTNKIYSISGVKLTPPTSFVLEMLRLLVLDGYTRQLGRWRSFQVLSFTLLFPPLVSKGKILVFLPCYFLAFSQGTWHFPQMAVLIIYCTTIEKNTY